MNYVFGLYYNRDALHLGRQRHHDGVEGGSGRDSNLRNKKSQGIVWALLRHERTYEPVA